LVRHVAGVIEPLLEESSFADVSVAQILEAANISRSAFYSYFSSKHDLMAAVAEIVMAEILEAGDGWWGLPPDATKEDMRDALRHVVEVWREHRLLLRSVTESVYQDAAVRDLYNGLVQHAMDGATAFIERAQAAGLAYPDIDARHVSEQMMYLAERSLYQIIGIENDRDYARFPDAMVDIFWRTVCEGYR
jgi:AcrR family transcriptional regulator